MIDLYTWTTPNGYKISIMLEELGLPYKVIPVDLEALDQHKPEFTAISPNQKIPAIVDHDTGSEPISIFESGAILIHLAEKTGQLLPTAPKERAEVMQWLMYQMSHLGPITGQAGHFANQAPKEQDHSYALGRFVGETLRILGVMNARLADRDVLAGGYSIADIASYPWVVAAWAPLSALMPDEIAKLPHLETWMNRLGKRPAVEKGMTIPAARD